MKNDRKKELKQKYEELHFSMRNKGENAEKEVERLEALMKEKKQELAKLKHLRDFYLSETIQAYNSALAFRGFMNDLGDD